MRWIALQVHNRRGRNIDSIWRWNLGMSISRYLPPATLDCRPDVLVFICVSWIQCLLCKCFQIIDLHSLQRCKWRLTGIFYKLSFCQHVNRADTQGSGKVFLMCFIWLFSSIAFSRANWTPNSSDFHRFKSCAIETVRINGIYSLTDRPDRSLRPRHCAQRLHTQPANSQ